ncbi:MAG: response regulator transcription factor [Acidimicrobiia bacterium]|nr:MAG: response regulator transcription factor [Acidimicrobiia bacterium]
MRIVIADDHRVVRDGIIYMLSEEPDIEIAGDAAGGEELLVLLDEQPVDVVLLDVRMPGMGGFEVLERIGSDMPQVRVLMLSMHDQPGYVRRAVELGAAGYLLKSSGREELLRAIRTVADGGMYLQGELMEPLVASVAGTTGPPGRMSPRERQVLQLIANGYENKQVATELGLSEATVKSYLRGIFERLEVTSRAQAVAVALRLGVIE